MAVAPRPSCRGYSLLEVVLVIGMSTLIVGGMVLALQSQERAFRAQGSGLEKLQNVDLAVRQLQQDLQLAGVGLPPGTLPAVAPGPGDGRPVLPIRYLRKPPSCSPSCHRQVEAVSHSAQGHPAFSAGRPGSRPPRRLVAGLSGGGRAVAQSPGPAPGATHAE